MLGRKIRALLVDLDGTLYFKGAPILGAAGALQQLKEAGIGLCFLTNTDSKSVRTIRRDLERMGFDVEERDIFTPATALRRFLEEEGSPRCHFLLAPELAREFEPYAGMPGGSAGGPPGGVDYVVVGDCREIATYETLNGAFRHVVAGAGIVALQKGRYYIREDGYYLDTGAFVELLEYASGKTARLLGKPSPDFFRLALGHVGCRPEEAAVVGDDVFTDVAGAKSVGALSILVRTGKASGVDVERLEVKPDAIADTFAGVPRLILS